MKCLQILRIASLLVLSLMPPCVRANVRGAKGRVQTKYQLKERNLESATKIITIDELGKYFLTFNEDSAPKEMEPFLLQLFDTDGDLPSDSLETVAEALEAFLLAELNAIYAPFHTVDEVRASFPEQTEITSGSELLTYLNVTFDLEPSPDQIQLGVWIETIMSDMTYFIKNLTYLDGGSDPELANITVADRKPFYERGGGDDEVFPGIDNNPPASGGKQPPFYSIVPTVFAASLVALLVGLYIVRRRLVEERQDQSPSEQRSLSTKLQPLETGVNVVQDDDMFSFEVSLLESPAVHNTPMKTVEVQEMESDLFSGIHSNVTASPRNLRESASVFSFLSGFTGTSASTVRASNVTKESSFTNTAAAAGTLSIDYATGTYSGTPKGETPRSRRSSLFAFSEEEEDEEGPTSEDEKKQKDENYDHNREINVAISEASSPAGDLLSPVDAPFDERSKTEQSPETLSQTDSPTESQSGIPAVTSQGSDISSLVYSYSTGKSVSNATANVANPEPESVKSQSFSTSTQIVGLSTESNSASRMASTYTHSVDRDNDNGEASPDEAVSTDDESSNASSVSPERESATVSRMVAAFGNFARRARSGKASESPEKEARKVDPEVIVAPSPKEVNLRWDSPNESAKNAAIAAAFVEASNSLTGKSPRRGRRHAKSTAVDGTEAYQSEAMQPVDWSIQSGNDSESGSGLSPRSEIDIIAAAVAAKRSKKYKKDGDTPRSNATNDSTLSALSISTNMNESGASDATPSPSKKLINDLVWLEKKIAGATKSVKSGTNTPRSSATTPRSTMTTPRSTVATSKEQQIIPPTAAAPSHPDKEIAPPSQLTASSDATDSISFESRDANVSTSHSNDSSSLELNSYNGQTPRGLHSIVCKDCYAPPGKLKIVIHSTKDGPAVHTVKPGSTLEGHIFPGDLIISVDNIDTRSYTAEQVMKMMTARTKFERKITVLHFEAR